MMQIAGGLVGDIYAHARRIAAEASEAQAPLVLEMEGVFDMFCEAQKMYAKAWYKDRGRDKSPGDLVRDSKGNLKLEVKGLAPARRDNCKWVRETIYTLLIMIMEEKGYYACVHYLIERIRDMYAGKFDLDQFVVSKSLSSGYKNDNAPMKVFAEEMAKEGLILEAGQRHEYVVIRMPSATSVAKRMLLISQFDKKRHKLDYDYYFGNLLMKKVDNTVTAQYGSYKEMADIVLRVNGRDINGARPAKLISAFIKEKGNLSVLDQSVHKIGREIDRNKRRAERMNNTIDVPVRKQQVR
jgi:DNA polymerase elongation subunit (family B)